MYKTLHKKQGSVTVQLRFARSSVTFCAKRDKKDFGFRCFFFHCRVPRRTFRWQVLQVYLEETGDKFVKLISIDTITAYW